MSVQVADKRITVRHLARLHAEGVKIVCLTAYTAPMAAIVDRHADVILVGDSLGMVVYGFDSTVPVTLDMMIAHGRAVTRRASRALVVVDLPFGSYQGGETAAFAAAAAVLKETGCTAVKLEGGVEMAATVHFLTQRGIPVMGHIGLRPQSVNASGGYRMVGRAQAEGEAVLADMRAIAAAGAFAIVLECVDHALAQAIVHECPVPVIGIGASADCAGQILVTDDLLGLLPGPPPRFVRAYAQLHGEIERGVAAYADDVRKKAFPADAETYRAKPSL